MIYRAITVLLILLLVGCSGPGVSPNGEHGSGDSEMGVPVREVSAYGFVTQVSSDTHHIDIKHAPIPEMNWAPMVMNFKVVEAVDLSTFKRGDKVQFVLEVDANLNYRIKSMETAATP